MPSPDDFSTVPLDGQRLVRERPALDDADTDRLRVLTEVHEPHRGVLDGPRLSFTVMSTVPPGERDVVIASASDLDNAPEGYGEAMTEEVHLPPAFRARGHYAKTTAKRTAIVDAALEVFAESGYRSGSLRDVAQRVGMSEAGLLHHFPSKSALLAAVLDRRDEFSLSFVPFAGGDGEAVLRGLVTLAANSASTPGIVELFCLVSAEATARGHPAHDYFVERYEYTRFNLQSAFAQLQAQGRLREAVTPDRAAIATIALMDGLQVQWLLNNAAVDMAAEIRAFLSDLVDIDFDEGSFA